MNFTSQICTTREQSKRLIALGLRRETADMMYQNYRGHCIGYGYDKYPKCITDLNTLRDVDIPAWSLHRLIEIYSKASITPKVKLDEINFEWLVDEIAFRIQECDIYKEYLKEK